MVQILYIMSQEVVTYEEIIEHGKSIHAGTVDRAIAPCWINTASHSYLKVHARDMQFSGYSFKLYGYMYLEEDCDAAKWINRFGAPNNKAVDLDVTWDVDAKYGDPGNAWVEYMNNAATRV